MKSRGFTLIEVLVAVAIFGVVSVLAYQAIAQTLSNAELLGDRMERLRAVQQTMRVIGRDLVQAVPRPIRDPIDGPMLPAMRTNVASSFVLEVTRGGWPNPVGLPRGTLQRVAWRVEDGELLRLHWPVLDPTVGVDPVGTLMLDNIESIELRYRLPDGEWSDQWPPLNVGGGGLRMRPQIVEVVLTLPDEGEIRRFFEVAP